MRTVDRAKNSTKPKRKMPKGVPAAVNAAFFRGLDDVEQGRTVSVESAVTEGRRRLTEFREYKKSKVMTRLATSAIHYHLGRG